MDPKRTAVLWAAGGLLALALVVAFAAVGAIGTVDARVVVVASGLAGATAAILGERLYLRANVDR
jgi:hypothetical protein